MRRLLSVFLLLASLQPSISTGRFEDNSLRGRPSRGLQNFFEPFGVGQTQVKYARTSGSAYSKGSHYYRSSSFKSTKEPHKTKSPTTSHPTRAPTVKGSSKLNSRAPTSGKGKGERKRKGGSPTTWYEGLDPQMDPLGDAGDEVSITYELFKDTTAKTLPVSAFLVTTDSAFIPLSNDFEEFAKLVRTVFQEMYSLSFADSADYDFVGVFLPRYTVVAPTLVDFEVNVYFSNRGAIPSLFEVESVAKEGFRPSAEFYKLLLGKMRIMRSRFYAQASTVQYITSAEDLNIAVIALSNDNTYSAGQIVLIIMLTLFGASVFALSLILLLKKRQHQRRTHSDDDYNPTADKVDKKFDLSKASHTVTHAPFRSNAHHTSPRVLPKSPTSQSTSSIAGVKVASQSIPRLKSVTVHQDDEDEFLLDENLTFDDIALEDEIAADAKKRIGEIRKSAFINDRMVTDKLNYQANRKSKVSEASQSRSDDASPTSKESATTLSLDIEEARSRIAEINKSKYRNQVTRSVPVDPSFPGSSKPWHTASTLHPVPESPESPHGSRYLDAPQRIFQSSSLAAASAASVATTSRDSQSGESGRMPVADDDASVFTIDSQSSATPEFLKKFKQMGLKRPKGETS